ncbi:MAG: ABC transporter ATP-binding protein [Verrucomicrobiae bacterium]|nr:ABC transporter ATP-binding protein [Verrucomicrobiae bacterium]
MPGCEPTGLQVEAVSFRYGSRTALRDVTFQVARGEWFGLLGPNGSGKTTLFRILSTLLEPQTGRVVWNGEPVNRHQLGVVFQSPSLDRKLTVRENLSYHARLYGWRGAALTHRIEELLEQFALRDRADDLVGELSGGLKRRVELAKALLPQPALLLLDEPGTGLDPRARRQFNDDLAALRNRDAITIVMTTHLLDEAERCDRLAILDEGRLIAVDTPAALRQRVGGDVVSVTARRPDWLIAQLKQQFGIVAHTMDGQVRFERDHGHQFVPQLVEAFPGEILSVSVGKPTLEDAFIHLTGHRL